MSTIGASNSPLMGSGLYAGYQSTPIERLVDIGMSESEAESFRRIQERYIRNRREQRYGVIGACDLYQTSHPYQHRDQRLDKLNVPDESLFAQYDNLPGE